MGRFRQLEHTADVGIVATGGSFGEALEWLAKGMFSVIADMEGVEARETIFVSVQSIDQQALIVDWLNELLYRFDAEGLLLKEFSVNLGAEANSLEAECRGERVDATRHNLLTDIKAATYHDLKVEHNGEWQIQVVLDV